MSQPEINVDIIQLLQEDQEEQIDFAHKIRTFRESHKISGRLNSFITQLHEQVIGGTQSLAAYQGLAPELEKIKPDKPSTEEILLELQDNDSWNEALCALLLGGQAIDANFEKLFHTLDYLENPRNRLELSRQISRIRDGRIVPEPAVDDLDSFLHDAREIYFQRLATALEVLEPLGSKYSNLNLSEIAEMDDGQAETTLTHDQVAKIDAMLQPACEMEDIESLSGVTALFLYAIDLQKQKNIQQQIANQAAKRALPQQQSHKIVEGTKPLEKAGRVIGKYIDIYGKYYGILYASSKGITEDNEIVNKVNPTLAENQLFQFVVANFYTLIPTLLPSFVEQSLEQGLFPKLTQNIADRLIENTKNTFDWEYTPDSKAQEWRKLAEQSQNSGSDIDIAEDLAKQKELSEDDNQRIKLVFPAKWTFQGVFADIQKSLAKGTHRRVFSGNNAIVFEFDNYTPAVLNAMITGGQDKRLVLQIGAKGTMIGIPEDYKGDREKLRKIILNELVGYLLDKGIVKQKQAPQKAVPARRITPIEPTTPPVKTQQEPVVTPIGEPMIAKPLKRKTERRLGLKEPEAPAPTIEEVTVPTQNDFGIVITAKARKNIPADDGEDSIRLRQKLGTVLNIIQNDYREKGLSKKTKALFHHATIEYRSAYVGLGKRLIFRIDTDPQTGQKIIQVTNFGPRKDDEIYEEIQRELKGGKK